MKVVLLVAAVLAVWLVHRTALWLEARGWLYYRDSRPSSSALGNAFLEVQKLVDPGTRHVLEEKNEIRSEREGAGDPPDRSSR